MTLLWKHRAGECLTHCSRGTAQWPRLQPSTVYRQRNFSAPVGALLEEPSPKRTGCVRQGGICQMGPRTETLRGGKRGVTIHRVRWPRLPLLFPAGANPLREHSGQSVAVTVNLQQGRAGTSTVIAAVPKVFGAGLPFLDRPSYKPQTSLQTNLETSQGLQQMSEYPVCYYARILHASNDRASCKSAVVGVSVASDWTPTTQP